MQALMKELRSLKQEEHTMVSLASKISDQLNRLKVEELALQNMIRIQNQEEDMEDESSYSELKGLKDPEDMEKPTDENTKPLDLEVGPSKQSMEEEEEEDDEEDEPGHEDLSQYVESLVAKSNHKT